MRSMADGEERSAEGIVPVDTGAVACVEPPTVEGGVKSEHQYSVWRKKSRASWPWLATNT